MQVSLADGHSTLVGTMEHTAAQHVVVLAGATDSGRAVASYEQVRCRSRGGSSHGNSVLSRSCTDEHQRSAGRNSTYLRQRDRRSRSSSSSVSFQTCNRREIESLGSNVCCRCLGGSDGNSLIGLRQSNIINVQTLGGSDGHVAVFGNSPLAHLISRSRSVTLCLSGIAQCHATGFRSLMRLYANLDDRALGHTRNGKYRTAAIQP